MAFKKSDLYASHWASCARAEYGMALIPNLSADLGLRHGKGVSRSNLIRFRQFFLAYPISATLSHLLAWSHIAELQTLRKHWSVRTENRHLKQSMMQVLLTSRIRLI